MIKQSNKTKGMNSRNEFKYSFYSCEFDTDTSGKKVFICKDSCCPIEERVMKKYKDKIESAIRCRRKKFPNPARWKVFLVYLHCVEGDTYYDYLNAYNELLKILKNKSKQYKKCHPDHKIAYLLIDETNYNIFPLCCNIYNNNFKMYVDYFHNPLKKCEHICDTFLCYSPQTNTARANFCPSDFNYIDIEAYIDSCIGNN